MKNLLEKIAKYGGLFCIFLSAILTWITWQNPIEVPNASIKMPPFEQVKILEEIPILSGIANVFCGNCVTEFVDKANDIATDEAREKQKKAYAEAENIVKEHNNHVKQKIKEAEDENKKWLPLVFFVLAVSAVIEIRRLRRCA